MRRLDLVAYALWKWPLCDAAKFASMSWERLVNWVETGTA